ncbi:MAG: nitrite reductase small subunit NirD [Pseudomonadota bacterium]
MTEPLNWVAVGRVDDIPLRGARCVVTPIGKIGVFRTSENTIYAMEDHCPHKGGPLTQGIVHDASVTCPLHNWVISLETGEAQGADEGRVATIPVKVEDGVISLGLEPAAAGEPRKAVA